MTGSDDLRRQAHVVDVELGVRVRSRRELLGLSQAGVAERMTAGGHAWHQTTVAKVESGERPVRLTEAVALAHELQFGGVDELASGRSDWVDQRLGQLQAQDVELRLAVDYLEQRRGQIAAEMKQLGAPADGEHREEA